MAKSKLNLENSNLVWNPKRRYKVNEITTLNGKDYQNLSGKNSEPGVGNDWYQIQDQIFETLVEDEFYYDENNVLRLNVSTYRQVELTEIPYTQIITLDFEPTFIYSVSVNGLPLIQNDYVFTSPNQLEILGELEEGDTVEIVYDFFINPPSSL